MDPALALDRPRAWRRFTLAQKLARFLVYLVIVAAIVVSIETIEIIPEFLYDAPEQVVDLFSRMWPVDWAHYEGTVHDAMLETIHIASLGTLLALVLALPVGILAAHNLVPFTTVNVEDGDNAEKLKNLTGETSAPVLQVGDKLIAKGFNEARWNTLLDQAGYPKSPGRRAGLPQRPLTEPTAQARAEVKSEPVPAPVSQAGGGYPKQ